MDELSQKPDVQSNLSRLKDFQRRTVDYVYHRLYVDKDCTNRFLVADEVGLGKTLVARGVIAKSIEFLWDKEKRIDIVYVCANGDIARQNINRLNVTGKKDFAFATRMTMLPLQLHHLEGNKLNFVSFTPGTSFDLRSQGGTMEERTLIYHMLRDGWGFGDIAGAKNLFQANAGKVSWRDSLAWFDTSRYDKKLSQEYLNTLAGHPEIREQFNDLVERFGHYRMSKNIPTKDQEDRFYLIGNFRRILAETCVNALEPDLIILDEFQRFKNLLEGKDEAASLAKTLFNFEKAKILLLSATPYKMYTMYHETAEDDHYQDFIRTVGFLFDSEAETQAFQEELAAYRQELCKYSGMCQERFQKTKESIENKLRRVMTRNERLAVSVNHNGMVIESKNDLGQLTPKELQSFAMVDKVAGILNVSDTVEYWKSAPYLLNIMDRQGYKLKEKLTESMQTLQQWDDVQDVLQNNMEHLLTWEAVNSYEKIDPCNSKLRTLLEQKVESGAWQLLWIPPSLPYYRAEKGPYAIPELQDYTKALVFSAWKVVPKVIAMLGSYEAERRIVKNYDRSANYQDTQDPLLRFGISEDHPAGMSNFNLVYPCVTLAQKIDPLLIAIEMTTEELPLANEVSVKIEEHINQLMQPILEKYKDPDQSKADEKWYWASLALLDHHYFFKQIDNWLMDDSDFASWGDMIKGKGEKVKESDFAKHTDYFKQYFRQPLKLGKPPEDLIQVLAKVAMASPAVTSLRSLLRLRIEDPKKSSNVILSAAARIALGFRSLFNLPDSITLIRTLQVKDVTYYWKSVLEYSLNGNFQAVMDEYLHILRESLGHTADSIDDFAGEIVEEIEEAVSLHTASLGFDEINLQERKLDQHTIRCRFALRFGDGKDEEENQATRADQVRRAFNSPFRPFILASTSIGQEGLDFHQYCHEIYHWNLPANPVDLEQREGRIHRYKGHAVRKNVVKAFGIHSIRQVSSSNEDPWEILFNLAHQSRDPEHNDIIPYWIYEVEDGYKIIRHVPALPLSRETLQMEGLRKTLVAYRMVFGQPRQEDLVKYLEGRLENGVKLEELLRYRIDLRPV
ncbi:MAG TPA: helicase-related protein [Bacillota bacterium]|nr:helicase-related protein [Bacillota bacterium]